jgi:hypothetical protein
MAAGDSPVEEAIGVLSNPRRRFVLRELERCDGAVALSVVARRLAAWERRCAVSEVPRSTAREVCRSLARVHVPRLMAAGLVRATDDADDPVDPDQLVLVRTFLTAGADEDDCPDG